MDAKVTKIIFHLKKDKFLTVVLFEKPFGLLLAKENLNSFE